MFVYVIKNDIDGKIYVGMHGGNLTPQNYLRSKFYFSRKGTNGYLFNAIRKHGEDNFSITPLMSVHGLSRKQLGELEKYYICCFRSQDPEIGYNMTPGGDGNTHEFRQTPEARQKIREANLGKPKSAETCKKLSETHLGSKNPMFGRSRPEDERKRISATLRSPERRVENAALLRLRRETGHDPRSRPVRCVNTGEIFLSVQAAVSSFGLKKGGNLSTAIRRGQDFRGRRFAYVNQ